ncbi:maleylpyruvate isomerase N-terminal domain-containing protein [Pseudofrankia asymbiotica]|uniref:Maleylpyruvate isomerase family mycothiol-dependent enzyme n=1 Tax=Pseudofrankia asymbiotica TaxID=1834516 RepID=A0A1V2IB93_9ACTN|nr:maleylpyruvate isomerase N-terminal domain-containing protein [Pseudofrankia asymbiotica]ONH30280.1 hypothetical protein BL253_14065 [Pseudofrankia asymbiotica]
MRISEHIHALDRDGERMAAAANAAGFDAKVPSAPGWRVRDLLAHTGRVHRWATSYLRTGNPSPAEIEGDGLPAEPDDTLLGWFRYGHAALVDALDGADPGMSCWTLWPTAPPAPSPLAFWARRQAHETAVHRVDAELALAAARRAGMDGAEGVEPAGEPAVPPGLGADGIDELLAGFYAQRHRGLVAPRPVALAVRCADTDDGWTIRIGPDTREVNRHPTGTAALSTTGTAAAAGTDANADADANADCTIRGAASDLYLFLWNRQGADRIDVVGDRSVLDLWRDRARIT